MLHLGLHKAHQRILRQTLFGDHAMRIRVASLTLAGEFDADLTEKVLDGQVTVDGTADITRTASLTLLEPTRAFDFDSDAPNDAALFLDRMIKIWYGVRVDYGDGPEWEDIPIFTGPISSLSRTGPEISVEAQGKEALCMGAVWKTLTLRKGRTKVSAIRIILRERAGETQFRFPQIKPTLPKDLTLNRADVPWTRARSIARSMDRQLFYNGDGDCVLRRLPDRPAVTFTETTLLSPVQVSYSQDETINAIFVQGGVPTNGKVRIAAEVFPPHRHPLSPWRLGRNNVPRYLMGSLEDNHLRSYAEARRAARRRLRQGLQQAVDASFDAMPMPLLEPGDMVRAVTNEGAVTFRASTFAISLTPGEVMTIGYTRNLRTGRLPRAGRLRMRQHTPEYWAEMQRWRTQRAKAKDDKPAPHKKNAAQPKSHTTHRRTTRHRRASV